MVARTALKLPRNTGKEFGPPKKAKLRELRKAKGLGQRVVAAEVRINFTFLTKIENEKVDFAAFPSEDTIRKLAKVLDRDLDQLLLIP